ncbi:MAG: hypothetical protein US83_C0015G0022 [Candidatus Falkowbacteria bacterium GW2011_GWC2_38_22]|nr:MAG: hypothetical protein US73_C0013G0022 [Candidatus Falkowbacteria bacterium GW2011_GWF2_38_1205]KKQ60614.1 MAG: hypothetical protein US83_C0015G0022 [Candidatus Falkowbacteria bacterium GW2011_GWC2_38_22]KKQ62705.1 MAG: hypothetical protein US84_C0012G0022 [Candidatus Falkowbacteria bacterium GW2011_GWF1_38_22]KKQ64832.1 MAG: hypothetical protein US87_C0012G0022 [Candidatus Falkowbacteria bacterium GW2011_GWE2_38_254]KKQ72074.1 MAG: hypothetical protein US93_C0012G0022 [Candidatus Falkowb
MPNKKSIILYLCVFLLIAGGVFVYNNYYYKAKVINLPGASSPTEETDATSTANDYNTLMTLGLEQKAKGDMGDRASYDKAIETFSLIIKNTESKYWLPYLNLGNTYSSVGNFVEADKAYAKAMEISGGGEITVYQSRIDSWFFDPTKKPEEIKKLYEEAIANVYDNVNLIKGYAGYLRDRGDKAEAIVQFKVLAEMFPEKDVYKEEIRNLGN